MSKTACTCNGPKWYIKFRKSHRCKTCKLWKERPCVDGADEQFVLFHAEGIMKYDKLRWVGTWEYKAKYVLDYLEWKKYSYVEFSQKRKDKIKLIKKALIKQKELWRNYRKKKPNKPL